jgi:hypothetical protein
MSSTAISTTREQPSSLQLANRGFVTMTNLKEAREFVDILLDSDLVPKDYRGKPNNCIIAMQMGMELGFPPLQAVQNISVINGRPSVWGDLIPAIVLAQPDCEDFKEDKPQGEEPEKWSATCTIIRRGKSPFVQTFTWQDAKRAGLTSKDGPWKQYPKRQLQMRARGFCARDAYPDRLKGLITAEEAYDLPTMQQEPSEPRRVGESATPAAAQQAGAPPPKPPIAPADAAKPATTAPPAAASAPPATSNGEGATEQETRGVKVLKTAWVHDAKGGFGEITTSRGVFCTREEGIFKDAGSFEDTDHVAAFTWRHAKRTKEAGEAVRIQLVTRIAIDEAAQAQQTELPTEGDANA